jgi:transposase
MTITQGYAKAHGPDVKQAVLELMVSHDGGVPVVSHRGEGHAADPGMFQERAAALSATLKNSPTPRSLVADATLSNEANAAHLQALGFLTRMPHTRQLVSHVSTPALRWDTGPRLDDPTREQRVA